MQLFVVLLPKNKLQLKNSTEIFLSRNSVLVSRDNPQNTLSTDYIGIISSVELTVRSGTEVS